jgi:hypothetical protein
MTFAQALQQAKCPATVRTSAVREYAVVLRDGLVTFYSRASRGPAVWTAWHPVSGIPESALQGDQWAPWPSDADFKTAAA